MKIARGTRIKIIFALILTPFVTAFSAGSFLPGPHVPKAVALPIFFTCFYFMIIAGWVRKTEK